MKVHENARNVDTITWISMKRQEVSVIFARTADIQMRWKKIEKSIMRKSRNKKSGWEAAFFLYVSYLYGISWMVGRIFSTSALRQSAVPRVMMTAPAAAKPSFSPSSSGLCSARA
jgi:hypothetical protein